MNPNDQQQPMMFPQMGQFIPVVGHSSNSLPDENTSEAILYGSEYRRIKNMVWAWDEMQNYLRIKAEGLAGQIMDRKWAYEVMTRNRYLIFARSPPVNNVKKLKDLFTLRDLVRCTSAIHQIDHFRLLNISWSRKRGIEEYVKGLAGRGISENDWKSATAPYNTSPITFDFINGLAPELLPEEEVSPDEAMRLILGEEEYSKLQQKILKDTGYIEEDEEYFDEDDEEYYEEDYDEEEFVEEEVEVEDEEQADEESDDESEEEVVEEETEDEEEETAEDEGEPVEVVEEDDEDDLRDTLIVALDDLVDDPIYDALAKLTEWTNPDDECAHIGEWLETSDLDNRAVIDQLIAFAKEVEV